MKPELAPIFQKDEQLRHQADGLFAKVAEGWPQCVKCAPGCDDCCHALFDLSLVEAMYINEAFHKKFGYGPARSHILEKASKTDRQLAKLKRKMFLDEKAGIKTDEILSQAALLRLPCPLLDDQHRCVLYEARPITCRLYGIPLDIGGKSHVCGLSAFEPGHDYPAVQVNKIQARLEALSAEIASTCNSRFELADIYILALAMPVRRIKECQMGISILIPALASSFRRKNPQRLMMNRKR